MRFEQLTQPAGPLSLIDGEGVVVSPQFSLFKYFLLMLIPLLVLQEFGGPQWGETSEIMIITVGHSVSFHPVNADGPLDRDEVGANLYPKDKCTLGGPSWAER